MMKNLFPRWRSRLVAALAALGLAAASVGAGEAPSRGEGEGPGGFAVRLLGGKAFAGDGRHGGSDFGGAAAFDHLGWVMGAQFLFISESSEFMGIDRIQPLEDYRLAGAFAGRQWSLERMTLILGLGAGILEGNRRTDLQRTGIECEGWSLFGCSEEDEVEVQYYASHAFRAASINPLLSFDVRVTEHFAVGLWAQALINAEQGLGTVALVLKFGS